MHTGSATGQEIFQDSRGKLSFHVFYNSSMKSSFQCVYDSTVELKPKGWQWNCSCPTGCPNTPFASTTTSTTVQSPVDLFIAEDVCHHLGG